jgi:hypothetical protein
MGDCELRAARRESDQRSAFFNVQWLFESELILPFCNEEWTYSCI